MPISPTQFAINPLQWVATDDGWIDPRIAPPLTERLARIAAAGFTAIQSEVPSDSTVDAYGKTLQEAGIRPGPGYVNLPWSESAAERAHHLGRAKLLAANNVQLGNGLLFLAMGMQRDAPRVAHPAVGYGHDATRLEQVRDYLAEAAQIITDEGGVAALHPHIGTWVETAADARFVLDSVDESILKFGPDAGHFAWTGIDPAGIIAEYRSRLAGIHIKDYRLDIAGKSRREDLDYQSTVRAGIWTEPGTGDADIPAILGAAGEDFAGWVVIEVDRGTTPSPGESVDLCGLWFQKTFGMEPASR
ncbi:sugar phosphate isomerase/epimerase [Pseudarthrobacter sp. lyk4-40-TYG-27]|uniref:sugar phosphate isomerase/epimerase family protein n=1 Tax=Pseudarthrobacter sp. lyk4-40-TYG-27 TaxID=3040305 RepID=UPI0025558F18|nr:sugar phosphate isomerase/epimerase [Pseudarthrobacter sp. lyk4-40-TYG-27]